MIPFYDSIYDREIYETIYDTLGLDNIINCINMVKAKAIFASRDYLANIIGILPFLPTVEFLISFDDI